VSVLLSQLESFVGDLPSAGVQLRSAYASLTAPVGSRMTEQALTPVTPRQTPLAAKANRQLNKVKKADLFGFESSDDDSFSLPSTDLRYVKKKEDLFNIILRKVHSC